MKKLLFFVSALCLFILVACNNSTGYNSETCALLKNKIDNKEVLTEEDYNLMIDQAVAAAKTIDEKTKEYENNPEKLAELKDNSEFKEMASYAVSFVFYLSFHEKELTPANIKKFQEAQKDFQGFER